MFARCALALPLLASACVGMIGDDNDKSGGGVGLDGPCAETPGRVGLARLTRAEYNRTVRDLFGVTGAPADAFPPDSSTNGFDNNAQSLTVSPQLASLLLDAAEEVAAEALTNKRDEIIGCDPAEDADCARSTLSALALRVYRRPPTDAEVDDLIALVDFSLAEGDGFDAAIEHALAGMLLAPQFLYRGVPVAAPPDAAVVLLDDYALASRLSYFLWGSTPDDALLARAGDGSLRSADGLRGEFDRMLADPKAAALYDGFFDQWLALGKLGAAAPDPALFPEFDEALRQAMWDETRLFFEDLMRRDASPLEIIGGTHTFANQTIAGIYGVSGPSGAELSPIDTDPARRAGVLTMPAILTMTSGPAEPNIVKRGVWLAETILCAAPPPPPAGVPAPPAPVPGETERERLERHRSDPSCASCHDLIDPLGFGFESYDAIGRFRDEVDGAPVDNLGKLPDGRSFQGIIELVDLLRSGDEFPLCVSQKLMTYALGRTMTEADQCVLASVSGEAAAESTLSDLLWAVVVSPAFQAEQLEGGQ